MIAETMAGIALVKGAVEGIKSAISTANDIGDIAHHIDNLFQGEQEIQKKRSKANKDPFAVNTIAEETINAKLAQEHMTEMRNLIDMRFGHGTWASIIAERSRRIQEQKDYERKIRIEKRRQKDKMLENLKIGSYIALSLVVFIGLMAIIFLLK